MADTARAGSLLGRAAARPGGEHVLRLARAVCLAVLVEPGLLRRARTGLVPGAGTGTESDLWFSPLVLTRNATGIVLDPDVITVLRQQLAAPDGDPGFADRAHDLIAELHAGHPAAVRLEEEVAWETVRHGSSAGPYIEARLRSAVKAMATDPDGGRAVARWASQAWWRLPEAATQTDAAQLLAVGAALRLGTATSVVTLAGEGLPASLGWLTPGGEEATTRLGVELAAGGLRFTAPGPGSLNLRLPRTSPLVVEIGWSDPAAGSHREVRVVAPGTDAVLGPMAGPVTVRTLTGQRYVIEPRLLAPPGPDTGFPAAVSDAAGSEALAEEPVTPEPAPAPATAPPVLNNLPLRPGRVFLDRTGPLDLLHDSMTERPGGATIQVIHGPGGMGKTELALQYAVTHQAYYSVIWWMAAEDAADIQTGLAGLAVRLDHEVARSGTTAEAAEWATGWLAAHDGWLLILDNVSGPADTGPLLRRLTGGHILVTTRDGNGWPPFARLVGLDILDEVTAVELLTTRARLTSEIDQRLARQLAAELGYLPLALAIAAVTISQGRMSLEEYLSQLREPRSTVSEDTGRSFERVWDVTIDAIAARRRVALRLLRVLVCYASDAIPRDILGGSGDAAWPGVSDDLDVLASYGVIALTPETVSVHRLLQSHARDSERLRSEYPSDNPPVIALEWLAEAIPDDPATNLASWPLLRALLPHAESLAVLLRPGAPALLGQVQVALAAFEDSQGQYEHALSLGESALVILEATMGPEHLDTVVAMQDLARAYVRVGRSAEALPLAQRALAITERTLGPDDPQTAARLENLAVTSIALGELAEALPLQQRSLAITEAAYGPDHPVTASRLDNLAVILRNLGRSAEALPLLQRSLAITEAAYGPDHPVTASRLNDLAVTYFTLGQQAEALPLAQRALTITDGALGPDHPDTARQLDNLAVILRGLGRVAEALPLQQRALAITEAAFGPEDAETGRRLANLAATYRDLGRADEALPLEQRAARIADRNRSR